RPPRGKHPLPVIPAACIRPFLSKSFVSRDNAPRPTLADEAPTVPPGRIVLLHDRPRDPLHVGVPRPAVLVLQPDGRSQPRHRYLTGRGLLGIRGAVARDDVVLGSRARMVAPPRRGRPGSGRRRPPIPEEPPGDGAECDRHAPRSLGRTIAAESSNSVRRMS